MQPFKRVEMPESEYDAIRRDVLQRWKSKDPTLRILIPAAGEDAVRAWLEHHIEDLRKDVTYVNNKYQVAVRTSGDMIHLSIRRLDRQACHDWREFQQIKNMLIGPECEAVELYPAESRLVDGANQYHLWGIKDPTKRLPFGFNGDRAVSDTLSIAGSVNRPLRKK
jgi:hypothetical protein